MGLLKNALPRATREHIARYADDRLPDGFIRKNFANGISVGGFLLVAAGAKIGGKSGLALRAVGEAADDVDGDAARALGTDSKSGAMIDVVLDKFKVGIELKKLWEDSGKLEAPEQIKRRLALGFIAGKHATNAALNVAAQAKGLEPHSSFAGRVNLWVDGVAIAAFGLSDVVDNKDASKTIANVGYTMTTIGAITGAIAAYGYARVLQEMPPQTGESEAPYFAAIAE